jgi:hypothetical protein
VLHLVDCSLLSPPRAGPDGRSRYVMLETLRAYGARLLADAGEAGGAAAALAAFALRTAEDAAAGLGTSTGDVAAARWLDAEDATLRQALGWAADHDPALVMRLAAALAPWWILRGRLAGESSLLRTAAGQAEPGSDGWCAAQLWLGWVAINAADLAAALEHLTAGIDAGGRGPSRPLIDCLTARATVLSNTARAGEAISDGRRALALARELGYPAGEAHALGQLSIAAARSGERDDAVHLARQATQVPDVPGWVARGESSLLAGMLTEAGDLTAAERVCAAVLARCRDRTDPAGDAGPAGGPVRRRRGAPARSSPDHAADRRLVGLVRRAGRRWTAVRRDRPVRRRHHGVGRGDHAQPPGRHCRAGHGGASPGRAGAPGPAGTRA